MANQIVNVAGAGRSFSLFSSAARTATPDTIEIEGTGRSTALIVVLDVTAVAIAPTVTVAVAGVDRLSGKTWPIVTSAAVLTTGTTVLRVAPGLIAVTNLTVGDILPPVVRITVTHGNSNSITYTLSAHVTN